MQIGIFHNIDKKMEPQYKSNFSYQVRSYNKKHYTFDISYILSFLFFYLLSPRVVWLYISFHVKFFFVVNLLFFELHLKITSFKKIVYAQRRFNIRYIG